MRPQILRRGCLAAAISCLAVAQSSAAAEDIEFVQEHLPEVAMDNRYGTLPVWSAAEETSTAPSLEVQAAWSSSGTGGLTIQGPLLSIAFTDTFRGSWRWGALAFYDPLQLKATSDDRPLQTLFSPTTPIDQPVGAHFAHLDGRATDYGAGVFVNRAAANDWLGDYAWTAGVLWQRVTLRDYRLDYEIVEGPQRGLSGQIDFDADYSHVTPFVGLQLPRTFGRWSVAPHALLAMPLPRRGIAGHITGPGFDLRGNTADVGQGKHFGDPSLTLGLTATYEPAHLSIDIGALATQALLEQHIHRGIESNYVLSFTWRY
jgi:hypothetical protein